mgnify:CR=1 FL=1
MTGKPDEITTEAFIQRLLSPDRARRLDTFGILTFSEISFRDVVADIGCGPGFFTIPLAKNLRSGKLYALDLDDQMLDACRDRVDEVRMGNVEVLKCGEYEFPIEPGSLNGVFLGFVIQASADKPKFLNAVRELLKPRGWCTVLEWYRKETEGGPSLERRLDPEELRAMAQEAGLEYRSRRELNNDQYMMTLRNR